MNELNRLPNRKIKKISKLLEILLEFENLGIIGRLRKAINFTDEPKFPQWFCEPSKSRSYIKDEQYGSSLWLDEETAKIKSIAEAIERYCLETTTNELILDSYENLKNSIDPSEFLNFPDSFFNYKKEEYIKKLRKAKLNWVKGINLKDNSQIFIPAQLVYSPYDFSEEPIIRVPISTGAAFGVDKRSAIERGLLEIVERDSFMLMWLLKIKCPKVDLTSDYELNKLKQYFNRYLLEPYVFDISTDIKIPSMMAILIDRTGIGPAVSVGLKASLDPKQAIIGALLEAQHVRGWIRFSYLKDGEPNITSPKQITDLKTRGHYWYRKEKIKNLEFILKDNITKNLSEIKNFKKTNLADYLIKQEFDIFIVDISIPELKKKGFYVVKVISPQFHPLYLNEDAPYLYSKRLEKYKRKYNINKLNREPHPFL